MDVKDPAQAKSKLLHDLHQIQPPIKDFGKWCENVCHWAVRVHDTREDMETVARANNSSATESHTSQKRLSNKFYSNKEKDFKRFKHTASSAFSEKTTNATCGFCGRHHPGDCHHKNSVHSNKESVPYKDSKVGKKYAALGYFSLPREASPALRAQNTSSTQGKYKLCATISSYNIANDDNIFIALPFSDDCPTREEHQEKIKRITPLRMFVDQGASRNFINKELAEIIVTNNLATKIIFNNNKVICTGLSDVCTSAKEAIKINISFIDSNNIFRVINNMQATIIDTPYDFIIGKPSIIESNFVLLFPHFFMSNQLMAKILPLSRTGGGMVNKSSNSEMFPYGRTGSSIPLVDKSEKKRTSEHTNESSNSLTSQLDDHRDKGIKFSSSSICSYTTDVENCKNVNTKISRKHKNCCDIEITRSHKNDLVKSINSMNMQLHKDSRNVKLCRLMALREEAKPTNFSTFTPYQREGIEDIPDDMMEAIPAYLIIADNLSPSELPTQVFGPESLQLRIRELLSKYAGIFSATVKKEPADVPPFELTVEQGLWEVPANKLGPRKMEKRKSDALHKQVELLVEKGVIQPSEQGYYSHGLVVPKSDDTWRFVVDYKNLNKISTAENWPIPNIKDMLTRIGDQRPKYFAVMDLTAGYHQAPIHANTRKWTAFMTFWGIYEWLRLPMGLKGAGAYFQRIMATIVLAGLVMVIVELYLDDIILTAQTEDSFIERLEVVFIRFLEHNITLNPKKCRFGMREVVYVGHTINEQGIHFSREKLDSVVNFPVPILEKQLKSFLGLANWFRDHIRNYANTTAPLHRMLTDYKRSRKLIWDTAVIDAFEQIKKDIDECPTLFFMDDISPIILETDASAYGIGAYLYQEIEGIKKPIAFISKSLDKRLQNWDVPEKEGYAIFYALQKWAYLLRDRKFTLKTDHENLTRLKTDYTSDKKVQKWLLCFQSYDYTLEYIPGETNLIADAFSRLCEYEGSTEEERLCVLTEFQVPNSFWKLLKSVHNSTAGHGGVERTLNKLKAINKVWQHQREHIRHFIKRCPCCQKMNQIKISIHNHPFTTSTYGPMERITIDTIEKLTPDNLGNTCIFVIIDSFTRFVEIYPSKNNTAEEGAIALLDHIGRYGAPSQIGSDNGRNFVGNMIRELI